MYQETMNYSIDNQEFVGELRAPNNQKDKHPAILIAHAWMGRDHFAIEKAEALAELGYVAFAADLYGNGQVVKTSEEAAKLMMPLFLDRALLQKRIRAAYDVLSKHRLVDSHLIGGIGFCFGGLTIIELLRSGANVKGVVSFHATFGDQKGSRRAKTVPIQQGIKGSLLALHGYDDPLVSSEDLVLVQKEWTEAKIDWQLHIYGHTSHAFTNPQANDHQNGLIFQPKSSERAWLAMRNFFEEIL